MVLLEAQLTIKIQDSLLILNLEEIFEECVPYIQSIYFNQPFNAKDISKTHIMIKCYTGLFMA